MQNEKIKSIIDEFIDKNESDINVWPLYSQGNIPKRKLNNALAYISKGATEEEILIFVDFTILGSGKQGLIFTIDKLFWRDSSLEDPDMIEYAKIDSVSIEGSELVIDSERIYIPHSKECLEMIQSLLNQIVNEVKAEEEIKEQQETIITKEIPPIQDNLISEEILTNQGVCLEVVEDILSEPKQAKELNSVYRVWEYKMGGRLGISESVSISKDGLYIASGSSSGKVYYFKKDGNLLWNYKVGGLICLAHSVSVTFDGSYIAAGSSDGIYFFNCQGELLWKNNKVGGIRMVSASLDGSYIAAWSEDQNIYFFNREGKLLWNYKPKVLLNFFEFNTVSISKDGSYVAAGSNGGKVYYLNKEGNLLWSFETRANVESVSVSSDGSYIAAGSSDGSVCYFNLKGALLWSYKTGGEVNEISISLDGSYIAAGSKDKNIYFLDRKGELLWSYETGANVESVSVSMDGSYIAAGSDKVYFFNKRGELLLNQEKYFGIKTISMSQNGSYIAAGSFSNRVYLFKSEAENEMTSELEVLGPSDMSKSEISGNIVNIKLPDVIYYGEEVEVEVNAFNTLDEPLEDLLIDFKRASDYFEISESEVEFPLLRVNMRLSKYIKFKPLYEGSFEFTVKIESSLLDTEKSFKIDVIKLENLEEVISVAEFAPKPIGITTLPVELENLYYDAEPLGKGGFARVFRAKRKTDDKVVAVKVPISLDSETGKSFVKEITVWQGLKHENIVELHDLNVLPIPYLELEYVENESLEEFEKPLEIDLAVKIVFEIADGLRYAHLKGVIHRDLKPQNVLLTGNLTPKITDWGLSKVVAETRTSSRYGFSPMYATPEQMSPKKFGVPDERTDIYQLGVIFYELVTGELPFVGDDLAEIMSQIISEEPKAPSLTNPEAKSVEHIILKCLQKKKEDRYQSIGEMQEELGKFLAEEYKKSLKESISDQNMKRSAYYCCELFMLHAKLNDASDALKYCMDMLNYASGEAKEEVEKLANELKFRVDEGIEMSEDLLMKARVLAHKVGMGWR